MINTDFRYFPYIVRDLVEKVRAEYDTENALTPYFEFGTFLELSKRVAIKNQIDEGKYPMVWLVWEANDSLQNWTSKTTYTVSPRLFICNFTDANYSSVDRYDANFIRVLFPIFELFKQYLEYSGFTTTSTQYKYKLAEHLYWGESLEYAKKQNILIDTLDAIEIKFENLEINKIC